MGVIIGRKKESEELIRLYHSNQAQLVAIYGRRRVGKTYLVRELFKEQFSFYHTGISPVELKGKSLLSAQLTAFQSSLLQYGSMDESVPNDWMEAFDRLISLLSVKQGPEKMVVFIDEMPWMDTMRSGFITAFEHFWNGWASGRDNLMLIVCGSATSWIQDNLINSYGGLYDRVTSEIQLSPFTLKETEELMRMKGVTLSRYDIIQLYMSTGGIPFYLSYAEPGKSLAQIIDSLFFARNAKLKNEFDRLFNSIFAKPDRYRAVVRMLARKHIGFTREEISEGTGIAQGGQLSSILQVLETSNFVERYKPFETDSRHLKYRLSDPFCKFYLTQVSGKQREEHFWQNNENLSALNSWRGYAFEDVCLKHVEQIKNALRIGGVSSENSTWSFKGTQGQKGMQIDLIINRNDKVVNLCEMKFTKDEFVVSDEYEKILRKRIDRISEIVSKRHNVQMTLVTTFGLKYGVHSGVFQNVVTIDSLFDN